MKRFPHYLKATHLQATDLRTRVVSISSPRRSSPSLSSLLPSQLQMAQRRKREDCYFKLNNVTRLHQDDAALSNSHNLQR